MNVKEFVKNSTYDETNEKIAELAESNDPSVIELLEEFLLHRYDDVFMKRDAPRLVSMALLQKGPIGVRALLDVLPRAPLSIYPIAIIGSLWYASKGIIISKMFSKPPNSSLTKELSGETIQAAQEAVHELVLESRLDPELFWHFLNFFSRQSLEGLVVGIDEMQLIDDIFKFYATGAIKISRRLISDFEALLDQDLQEESYQLFLSKHPVFIDPLAVETISKQKLGIEFVTDFVIRRYDNRYSLIEIERPQDSLFTKGGDFTARFTHAFGQVLDFQQWVEENIAYAQKLLPGIASPTGVLIMGRREDMSDRNRAKLHRLSVNTNHVEILTFDDLVQNALLLYKSMFHEGQITKS